MNCSGTYIVGDVHGEFGRLNAWVNKKRPEIILQCGDFGYWPRHISKREKKRGEPIVPKIHDTKLYWIDGNHEDHWSLRGLEDNEVYPTCFT